MMKKQNGIADRKKTRDSILLMGFLLIAFIVICIVFGGRIMDLVSGKKTVGKDVRSEDITDFYYTYSSSTYPPDYQRYRFYVEDGNCYFYHEKREGDHWPLTEEDITLSGTKELSAEEWNEFFAYLAGGMVQNRSDDAIDGDAGPWLYLYWKGDHGTMQEFTFASWEKEKEFEAYCLKMMEQ